MTYTYIASLVAAFFKEKVFKESSKYNLVEVEGYKISIVVQVSNYSSAYSAHCCE